MYFNYRSCCFKRRHSNETAISDAMDDVTLSLSICLPVTLE